MKTTTESDSPTDHSAALRSPPGISRRAFLVGAVSAGAGYGTLGAGRVFAATSPVSDEELAWTPGWRLREMFIAKQLSPLEYAEFLLRRVERHSDLGAFISVFPETYLSEAARATELIMKGADLPLLHGLPVSIKDTVVTKGQRTTFGSLLFEDYVPDIDSVPAERVKQLGGIIFAKNNTPEFGMNRRTVNLVSREAVNPWNRDRSSGGSSGGAGVASAAGLGPLAIGTDGGGSIRIPSAFNGVFGLHPSRGRVPSGAGRPGAGSGGTSGIGPMTRDVRDAAYLMQAIACVDKRDPFTMTVEPPDYLAELDSGVRGLRMAWSPDLGRVVADEDEVVEICHEVARSFEAMGAIYSEPDIRLENPHDELEPDREYSREKMAAFYRSVEPGTQNVMEWAATLSPQDYAKLSIYFRNRNVSPNEVEYALTIPPHVRHKERTRMSDLFSQIDLLMTPTIGRTAFPFTELMSPWPYTAYTFIVNVSGYCAASVPAGFYNGLPVGLQIIGRPNEEHLLLRAARALERERPWAQFRPELV